jgi:hypothetical protein
VIADSGDHDNVPDNCELVTMRVSLVNDGTQDLTNVKVGSVASIHPAVRLAAVAPESLGDLALGESKPTTFKLYLGRDDASATCGEPIPFTVSSSSDQAPEVTRELTVAAETDTTSGTLSYGFESDLSGWTVTTGSFTRVAGGAPGSTAFSLHSRNANGVCDAVVSPIVIPTPTSVLSMWVNYGIQANPATYDRAVVRVVNVATGAKTLIMPFAGTAPYNTVGTTSGLCDGIGQLFGWAGSLTTWSPASLNIGQFAGVPIQIEVRFATNASSLGPKGFWFDAVQMTNVTQVSCDSHADVCVAQPSEVSPTGDPVPFTLGKNAKSFDLRFSEVPAATAYNVYAGTLASLARGTYDHGATPGLCGFTDNTPGDGFVAVSVPDGLPDDSYFLVVASDGSLESTYGSATAGTIPIALAACN